MLQPSITEGSTFNTKAHLLGILIGKRVPWHCYLHSIKDSHEVHLDSKFLDARSLPIKLEIVDVEKVKGLSNYYVSVALIL